MPNWPSLEKIAAQAEAAQAAAEAEAKKGPLDRLAGALKSVADGKPVPKTRLTLEGDVPVIGHPGDPIVHALDDDFEHAILGTSPEGKMADAAKAAEAVPGFQRTAEHNTAITAYRQLQEEALNAFKRADT
jgi:hypothetical protein